MENVATTSGHTRAFRLSHMLLALVILLLGACGGDSGGSSPPSNKATLKVLIRGYEGVATVEVNGTPYAVTGGEVETLSRFDEGTDVLVALTDWNPPWQCVYNTYHVLLLDGSRTVVFYCSVPDPVDGPLITTWSAPALVTPGENVALHLTVASDDPVLGFSIEVIEHPEGGTLEHLTPGTPTGTQYIEVDQYGVYRLSVRALTAEAASEPVLIALEAINEPPLVTSFTLAPIEAYTDTDLSMSLSFHDTDAAAVDVVYEWYLNDVLLTGQTGTTLSADLFAKGDVVAAKVVLTDGENTVTKQASTTILDSVPILQTDNIPPEIMRGTNLDIALHAFDADGNDDLGELGLVYGPSGMRVEDNRLLWHGDPILMGQRGTFRFGIAAAAAPELVIDLEIDVTTDEPHLRAFSQLLPKHYDLTTPDHFTDYDDDGKKEMIQASEHGVSIVEFGDFVGEEWSWSSQETVPGRLEFEDAIFVPQPDGTTLVAIATDRVLLIDPATNRVLASHPLDGVRDPTLHFAKGPTPTENRLVVKYGESYANNQRLVALDAQTLVRRWDSIALPLGTVVMVANVDNDEQDEIFTSKGLLFDASTGANQWVSSIQTTKMVPVYNEQRGYSLGAYSSSYGTLALVDFSTRAQVGKELSGYYSFTTGKGNVDDDADDELLVVNGRDVAILDVEPTTLVVNITDEYQLDEYVYPVTIAPDYIASDRPALVEFSTTDWRVHEFGNGTALTLLDREPCTTSARFLLPDIAEEQVLLHPSLVASCQNSAALVDIDPLTGETSTSGYAGSPGITASVFGHIDADANTDLALASSNRLHLFDMALDQETWFFSFAGGAKRLEALDLNGDGSKELVVVRNLTVEIYDVANQSILAQTPVVVQTYNRNLVDAAVSTGADGKPYLVVASEADLRVYALEGGDLELLHSTLLPVTALSMADVGADSIPEIIVQSGTPTRLRMYDLQLNLLDTLSPSSSYTALSPVPASRSATGHLLGIRRGSSYSTTLVEIDLRNGAETWQGPYSKYPSSSASPKVRMLESEGGTHLMWVNTNSALIGW